MNDILGAPIQYVKGVGPRLAKLFEKKGINTVEDALYFIPRGYEDRTSLKKIVSLRPGESATVLGTVTDQRWVTMNRKHRRFEVTVEDDTGSLQLVWFNAYKTLAEDFAVGSRLVLYGEVKFYQRTPQIVHPEYEKVGESGKPTISYHFGRVVPVYSETEGLHQKTLRRIMAEVVKSSVQDVSDALPEEMRTKLGLPSLRQSFVNVHFPERYPGMDPPSSARRRLVFEEFFVLQLGLLLRRQNRKKENAPALNDVQGIQAKFVSGLPFTLTNDQTKVLETILTDLKKNAPMTRLVQGDVGSGKTVVAFAAAAVAASAGYQTALMAPTEVLAQQHFRTAEKFLKPIGVEVECLTHSNSKQKEVLEKIASGRAELVIGTHALFQEKIIFHKLGLVVVDEQHRFGVDQRHELMRKADGTVPHLLVMTATPIPRTLALTLYGDLDFSVIREKPPGRKPVKTQIIADRERQRIYEIIRQTVQRGEQVYIIYPLVEQSDKLELKSATEMSEKLQKDIFPNFKIALVHGRMKGEEKDALIGAFKEAKYQILVSTTVIEVGIDVPNATLMVIEHPERLGLSQLHQLRGRVGRGAASSQCLLIAEHFVTERLKIIRSTEDGFMIAEEDLRLRGPGEFLGTRQSGLPGFRVGHILRDAELLATAKTEAANVLKEDPDLQLSKNRAIREMVESRWKEKIERLRGA